MRGNITRRGKLSWRLKVELEADPVTGKRRTRYVTVRGTRKDAERELAQLVSAVNLGVDIDHSGITLARHLETWLATAEISPKTRRRYRQLVVNQILPHLGALPVQRLRPAHLTEWLARLATTTLAPASRLYAFRVLSRSLEYAVQAELVARNVARAVKPPAAPRPDIAILRTDQIGAVLTALQGHSLEPIAVLALTSGLRRGEILALRWSEADLDTGILSVTRSLEQAGALRFKTPKTRAGARTVTLPAAGIAALRAHRIREMERRLARGLGRADGDALIFSAADGSPVPPDTISRAWHRFVRLRGLPLVTFHSLRHTHASALIAAGVGTLQIAKRLGHAGPGITLEVYGHLMKDDDAECAKVIEAFVKPL